MMLNARVSAIILLGILLIPSLALGCGRGDQPDTPAATGDRDGTTSPTKQIITATVANTAPRVDASAQITEAAILQLSGSVLDETLPEGNFTPRWSRVSGPGPVEFAHPSRLDTTATFTVPGTYVLRLTASDGEFTISDDVSVEVRR